MKQEGQGLKRLKGIYTDPDLTYHISRRVTFAILTILVFSPPHASAMATDERKSQWLRNAREQELEKSLRRRNKPEH